MTRLYRVRNECTRGNLGVTYVARRIDSDGFQRVERRNNDAIVKRTGGIRIIRSYRRVD